MAADQISGLTVDELRRLIHQTVSEAIDEKLRDLLDELHDTDAGYQFRPEIAAHLEEALKDTNRRGRPHEEVVRELGLDD